MIRAIGDLTHRERLRPLARHSNQRVRQETLKTLLHFRDSVAEQQVLQDMDDDDLEIRKMAIHLAEKNPSQKIFNKVLSFLAKPGLSAREYELKCAAVQSLAEIGKEEALPSLSKVLESRNILHPVLLTRLKLEIVRSLERYPVHSARQVLKRLSAGKDRLAQQAEQSLRSIAGQ
jgi:HEAT repeat protein